MSVAFWSTEVRQGRPVTVVPREGCVLHIRQVAISGASVDETASETRTPLVVNVEMNSGSLSSVIGPLRPGLIDQCNVDLVVGCDEEVTFTVAPEGGNTTASVFLVGHLRHKTTKARPKPSYGDEFNQSLEAGVESTRAKNDAGEQPPVSKAVAPMDTTSAAQVASKHPAAGTLARISVNKAVTPTPALSAHLSELSRSENQLVQSEIECKTTLLQTRNDVTRYQSQILTFGKFRGRRFDQVDESYRQWALEEAAQKQPWEPVNPPFAQFIAYLMARSKFLSTKHILDGVKRRLDALRGRAAEAVIKQHDFSVPPPTFIGLCASFKKALSEEDDDIFELNSKTNQEFEACWRYTRSFFTFLLGIRRSSLDGNRDLIRNVFSYLGPPAGFGELTPPLNLCKSWRFCQLTACAYPTCHRSICVDHGWGQSFGNENAEDYDSYENFGGKCAQFRCINRFCWEHFQIFDASSKGVMKLCEICVGGVEANADCGAHDSPSLGSEFWGKSYCPQHHPTECAEFEDDEDWDEDEDDEVEHKICGAVCCRSCLELHDQHYQLTHASDFY